MSRPHNSTTQPRSHNGRWFASIPIEDRFWTKVQKTDTCWLWTAAKADTGYGVIRLNGKNVYAHRLAYEMVKGPIPEGLTIDHLCRVRHCCNPDHLEAVTQRVNMLRGNHTSAKAIRSGHCKYGHEFTPDNTIVCKNGSRACRTCHYARNRRYAAARRESAKTQKTHRLFPS